MPPKRRQPIAGSINPRHRANQQRAATADPSQQTRAPADQDPLAMAGDSQAKRVILRFGGVQNLLKAMLQAGIRRTRQSVYFWVREGGLIPPRGIRDVMLAEVQVAKADPAFRLTDQDWSPYTFTDAPIPPAVVYRDLDNFHEPLTPEEDGEAPETTPPSKREWVL